MGGLVRYGCRIDVVGDIRISDEAGIEGGAEAGALALAEAGTGIGTGTGAEAGAGADVD